MRAQGVETAYHVAPGFDNGHSFASAKCGTCRGFLTFGSDRLTGMSTESCACGMRRLTPLPEEPPRAISGATLRKRLNLSCACGRPFSTYADDPSGHCRPCRNKHAYHRQRATRKTS